MVKQSADPSTLNKCIGENNMARGPVGKYLCAKCNKEISLLAKTRHDRACDGIYRTYKAVHNTATSCVFCLREFNTAIGCGAHITQCDKNPDRIYRKTNYSWNKGKTKETDFRLVKSGETLKRNIKPGHGKCADPEKEKMRREKISSAAKRLGFGGYRENAGISKKFKVIDSFGKETTLQSSYELECSQLLDKLQIKWNRPKAMKYGGRNYFADFYLPEYDVYLDPKNNYKAKLDAEKIAAVIEENKVRLFVLLKEQITEEYLVSICRHAND